MKLVVLFIALLSANVYAYENPPMNQIGELGSYAYDDEYLLSNMVYAVNERVSALYKNYSIETNCAGTFTNHNYWVDKIPTESWLVAWGTNTFEIEYTVTNTFNGETLTNTFTNLYLDFEYDQGSEPEGYVWSSNFNPQVIRHINEAGKFRGFSYSTGKDVYSNALLRVVSNDFSDVYGIRMTANKPYVPCESNYFFTLARDNFYKQSVFSKIIELMPYYVGVEVDQYTNYPFWIFAEWPPYTPHVFQESGPDLLVTPGRTIEGSRGTYRVDLCNQIGDVYFPCWRYYSPPEWKQLSTNSLTSTKDWLSLLDYINKYNEQETNLPYAFLGSNLNERQYFFSSTGESISVNGWEVNQLTNQYADQNVNPPFIAATNNPTTNYFFESQLPGYVVSVYDTNNIAEYIKMTNAMPMFEVSYLLTQTVPAGTPIYGDCSECSSITYPDAFWDCLLNCFSQPASTNEKTYRKISPVYNEYGMKDLLAQRIGIYPTNSIDAFLQTKTSYTNWGEFDAYDAITVTNKMGQFVIATNKVSVGIDFVVNEFRNERGSVTQIVEKGESESINVYQIPGEYTDDEPVSMSWTGSWYKSTTFPAYTAYTSYYETVTNIINGEEVVTNYWEPNFDLTLRHFAYATNVMPERIGLLASDRPFYFDYDNDIYAFLWNTLKQMTKTRPASFVYNTNVFVTERTAFAQTNRIYGLATTLQNTFRKDEEVTPTGIDGTNPYPPITETNIVSRGTQFYTKSIPEAQATNWLSSETNHFANISSYFNAVNFVADLNSSYTQNISVVNWSYQVLRPEFSISQKKWQKFFTTSASTNYVNYDFYAAKDPSLSGTLKAFSSIESQQQPNFWSAEAGINCFRVNDGQNAPFQFYCAVDCEFWDDVFVIEPPELHFEDIGEVFYADSPAGEDRVNFVYSAPIPITQNIVGYDQTGFVEEGIVVSAFGVEVFCQKSATGNGEYRGGENLKEYLDLFWEWDFNYAVDDEQEAE